MDSSSIEKLVRSCLYNWIGYGNLDADTWFVGTEEGGAEIWRRPPAAIVGLSERERIIWSLDIRSKFHPVMDFQKVWKQLYQYGDEFDSLISTRNNVWRYIAAFHLYQEGKILSTQSNEETEAAITDFLKTDFGSPSGGFLFTEFWPLPKGSQDEFPDLYKKIWPSISDYSAEVANKRSRLMIRAIEENKTVRCIVSFSRDFSYHFLQAYPENSGDESQFPSTLLKEWSDENGRMFKLYSVRLGNGREIKFLQSPFFGYMGYGPKWHEKKGLPYAASLVQYST